ncbi:MAG: hypothetical protein CMB83_00905 [Flammeovirgaceae bacterium]|nr:hypothetical protein [Flammeovirgaceae bacterium]
MINKINKRLVLTILLTAPGFLLLTNFLPQDKKATFSTFAFFLLFCFFNLVSKVLDFNENKFTTYNNLYTTSFLIIIYLILILFTQNYLLNFEIIDWDIPSYMVASNEIKNGYLPNETQWESKGPVLIYMYYFVLKIVSGNFIYFKVANDLILLLISLILFATASVISKNKLIISSIPTFVFILFMSQPWAVSGYSELYALVFISLGILIYKVKEFKFSYFLIGLMFSMSTLVNQGTILFLLPLLIGIFGIENYKNKLLKIFIGFTLPHLIFLYIYQINDLLNVYFATFVTIPISYTSANYSNLYELKVFMRSFFEFNPALYFVLLIVFILLLKSFFYKLHFLKGLIQNVEFLLVVTSLLFYFVASHNYYHHLLFFLYFISLYISKTKFDVNFVFLISFVLLSVVSSVSVNGYSSYKNLKNIESVYENYPLRQLAIEIEKKEISNLEILALDYNLLLHYLGQPNYSYIVHGTNFLEPYILSSLEEIRIIESDYLNSLKNKKPNVIICSEYMIVRGEVETQLIFPCNQDHLLDYYQLNTDIYFTENLNYYRDPYKEIKLFIKR